MKKPDGTRFELEPDHGPERWHWTGNRVIQVDEEARTFQDWTLPRTSEAEEYQPDPPSLPDEGVASNGAEPARVPPVTQVKPCAPSTRPPTLLEQIAGFLIMLTLGPLKLDLTPVVESVQEFPGRPFLLGMPRTDLLERFDMRLVKATESEFWLEFIPKHMQEQPHLSFERAVLILKADDCIPKALKWEDATGTTCVHVLENVSVTSWREGEPILAPNGRECLDRPDLRGFSPVGQ